MFNGQNVGGKQFEVIDEDGDVLDSFDDWQDALDCGRRAPWYRGTARIRRDHRYAPAFPKRIPWIVAVVLACENL